MLFVVGSPLLGMAGDAHPELTRLSPTEAIWFDPRKKELVVGGKVVLDTGPIELFACPVASKEHESIVAVQASPRLIYTGLLAIGLQPDMDADAGGTLPAAKDPPQGPRVRVQIRWRDDDGRLLQRDAREWIRSIQTGEPLATDWVFRGGGFRDTTETGTVIAGVDTSDLICVANFPAAMLALPLESPADNGLLVFEAFTDRIPAVGTPLELILSGGTP